MRCFSVIGIGQNNQETRHSIRVVNDGIGLNGDLARLGDGIIFPKPEIIQASIDMCVPPSPEHHLDVITEAEVFQFSDDQGKQYMPVIVRQQKIKSGELFSDNKALVYWVVNRGLYPFALRTVSNQTMILAERLTPDAFEMLILLEPGGFAYVYLDNAVATASWDGSNLNVSYKLNTPAE